MSPGSGDNVLEIRERRTDDAVVLTLVGELDLSTAGKVERRLEALRVDADAPRNIVLDLDELGFMDSTGIRLVLVATQEAERDGRRFAVTRGSDAVRRLFDTAGLTNHLPYTDKPPE